MKKLNIILFLICFTTISVSAQENEQTTDSVAKQEQIITVKKTKVDISDIPHPILIALRDSYAKHYVMKAYKTSKDNELLFVELQKSRKWFTVAIDGKGRIVQEIHKDKATNTLAGLN